MEYSTTETFWTRNARLLAFFITVAVLIAGGVLVSILANRDVSAPDDEALPEITLERVVELSHKGGEVYLSDLTPYRGHAQYGNGQALYSLYIGNDLLLYASAYQEDDNDRLIYMSLIHLPTGDTVDALLGNVEAFLAKHGKEIGAK